MIDLQLSRDTLLEEIEEAARRSRRDPASITLVVASKRRSAREVGELFAGGQTHFAENRVPDLLERLETLPKGIEWHFIGTLQRNKVRKVVGKVALIHSVDSIDLADKISQVSLEMGVRTKILLQVNTSGEKSKHGLSQEEWLEWSDDLLELPGIELVGLMTMAPLTEYAEVIRSCFRDLRLFRDQLQAEMGARVDLRHLSMGMSHDFLIAIEEGATLLRIGTRLFEGK